MSRQFDDYMDRLPEPLINEWFDKDIDLESDDAEWKRIEGYPDYFVSRHGEVGSCRTGKFIILKPWTNQYGHHYVQVYDESGVRKRFLIHRLVAEAFIGHHKDLPIVRHLDDDPENNQVTNLSWGTQQDNINDCIRHDRNFKKAVYCYELGKTFKSCAEVAEYFEVGRPAITACCSGKNCSIHNEYHLCYVEDLDEKLADVEKWTWKAGTRKRVKAINVETGEERIYRSRQSASEDLHIPDSYISNIIAGRGPSSTRGWTFEDLEGKYA